MPYIFAPDVRQQLLTQLKDALEASTIQALRQMARDWGWPLKGTAKSDVVSQMLGYLSDPQRMAAAIQAVPEDERAVLGWLNALTPASDPNKPLQQVLAHADGRQMTQKAVGQLIQSLLGRGLAFFRADNRYFVPRLFLEWLPPVEAPLLRYTDAPAGELATGTQFTLAAFNQHVQHLLTNIEMDQPEIASAPQPTPAPYSPTDRASAPATPRPGLVASETLSRWGYLTTDERFLARFLLEQSLTAGLCNIDMRSGSRRLRLTQSVQDAWEALPPVERLNLLRQRWLTIGERGNLAGTSSWNELDLALHRVLGYSLRSSYYWNTAEPLSYNITMLRIWLLSLTQGLQPDTWHSIEQLCSLAYQLHRDLLVWDTSPANWRWYRDKTAQDPQQMPFEAWLETYGKLIEAWLTGPANWLLFVQVGFAAGKPVAFRTLSQVPSGEATALPADVLRFTSEAVAVLRNTWQSGGLRQLLRRVAVETGRDRETTTYRLDVVPFRRTLQTGLGAQPLAEAFAAAGFPLPPATRGLLQTWQQRAGRHQLYDAVAIIEFSEEMHPEEARAIAGLGFSQFYQAAPRCLVVLNPDSAPAIIDELRRRGYTPQVLS